MDNDSKILLTTLAISSTLILSFIGFVSSIAIQNQNDLKDHQLEPAHGVALEKFDNINEKVIENNSILKQLIKNGD